MKKQVAIVTRKMITGGVERALISMLKVVDYSTVDVDLYVQDLGGELQSELPSEVRVFQLPTVKTQDVFRHPFFSIKKAILLKRLQHKEIPFEKQCYLSSKLLLPIKKKYDIAISYHAPNTVPVFYVIDGISAEKRILWLHGDMENNAGSSPLLMIYHRQFDHVYAVSKSVYDSFLTLHPEMKDKVDVFFNLVDEKSIREKAEKALTFQDGFDGIRLLTIGRLSEQKGIDIAIDACQLIVKKGYNIRWYICGEGEEYSNLLERVKKQ